MTRRPLTYIAHEHLGEYLTPGTLAIDATVGNGHDTLFLAEHVTPGGHIFGFDIQPVALQTTKKRLAAAGLTEHVTLVQRGHEQLADALPKEWHGQVAAVMFNLGYLPGGDKQTTTHAKTTCAALEQSRAVLQPSGWISLLVYRDHVGAAEETNAVVDWVSSLGKDFDISCHESPGPVLYLIRRHS